MAEVTTRWSEKLKRTATANFTGAAELNAKNARNALKNTFAIKVVTVPYLCNIKL